jgi:hypothetical protein
MKIAAVICNGTGRQAFMYLTHPSLNYRGELCKSLRAPLRRHSALVEVMKQAVKSLRNIHPWEQVAAEVPLLVDITFQEAAHSMLQ